MYRAAWRRRLLRCAAVAAALAVLVSVPSTAYAMQIFVTTLTGKTITLDVGGFVCDRLVPEFG